jgi:hypothetical protein
MAMLQAARARALGLPQDSAYSWGLNRSIFYAAAKRGFKGRAGKGGGEAGSQHPEESKSMYSLGNDQAYRDVKSEKLYFTIGGRTQTEKDFQEKIASRFGSDAKFRRAWKEATEIVQGYDAEVLKSGQDFYAQVYKPRRDELAGKWASEFGSGAAQ